MTFQHLIGALQIETPVHIGETRLHVVKDCCAAARAFCICLEFHNGIYLSLILFEFDFIQAKRIKHYAYRGKGHCRRSKHWIQENTC